MPCALFCPAEASLAGQPGCILGFAFRYLTSPCSPRFPAIDRAIIQLGDDEEKIIGALRTLQRALLPSDLRESKLFDVIQQLEEKVADRSPTINPILNGAAPTLSKLVAALLAENEVIAPSSSAGGPASGDGGSGPGGGVADGIALTLQTFKDVEAALLGLDLDSEGGQRAAISYVLGQGECVLAMRILLHPKPQTSDSAASRTPTCTKLELLRPHIFLYLNHTLRLNFNVKPPAVPTVPLHMESYSFATSDCREDPNSLLAQFLRFEFNTMDFFSEPYGAGAWFRKQNVSESIEIIAPANYYCIPANVKKLKGFLGVLLAALGIPRAPPAPPPGVAQGYSWQTYVDLYLERLDLAGSLPLMVEQYEHIQACSNLFSGALTYVRHRVTSLIRATDPGPRSMEVALFPADSSPITSLDALESEIKRKREARGSMAGAFEAHKGAAAVTPWERLKLDDSWYLSHVKKVATAAAKKAKFGAEPSPSGGTGSYSGLSFGMDQLALAGDSPNPNAGQGLPPGCLCASWRFANGRLVISALSWDLGALAKHLCVPAKGQNAPCWPYHLSLCEGKNRMARCDKTKQAGHNAPDAAAHQPVAGLDLDVLSKDETFARPATVEEKLGLNKNPVYPDSGRGGKGGRGARGRGQRGGRAVGGGERGRGQVAALKRQIAALEERETKRSHGDAEAEAEASAPSPSAAAAQLLVSLGEPPMPPPPGPHAQQALLLQHPASAMVPAAGATFAPPAPQFMLLPAPGAPPAPSALSQPHFQAPPPARVSWWRQDHSDSRASHP